MSLSAASSSINSTLKFLKWQKLYEIEKPFQVFINIPNDAEDKRTTNLVFEDVNVQVSDVRKFAPEHFTLDRHGFMYRKHNFTENHVADREAVEGLYLPEMETFLKSQLKDVDRVFFFDWRVSFNNVFAERGLINCSSAKMLQKFRGQSSISMI